MERKAILEYHGKLIEKFLERMKEDAIQKRTNYIKKYQFHLAKVPINNCVHTDIELVSPPEFPPPPNMERVTGYSMFRNDHTRRMENLMDATVAAAAAWRKLKEEEKRGWIGEAKHKNEKRELIYKRWQNLPDVIMAAMWLKKINTNNDDNDDK